MLGHGQLGWRALGQAFSTSSAAYTLTPATGADVLTGVAANQKLSRFAVVAAFVLSGKAVTWPLGLKIPAGVFAISGKSVSWPLGINILTGSFTLTGQTAKQFISHISSGAAYILTGLSAYLFKSQNLYGGAGSFSLTGLSLHFVHSTRSGFDRIRQTIAVLYKTRVSPPELEQ